MPLPPVTVEVPNVGPVVLVDRDQMRRASQGRTLKIPSHLKAIINAIPTPPATFDWGRNESIKYPISGNDRYGNCYYVACANGSRTYTGNVGPEVQFDINTLIARYLKISGGDNGLGDDTMIPEWKGGIIGPLGPRKVLSTMTVKPDDDASTALALWAFCGLIYTFAVPDVWINNANPGAIWDTATPNPRYGHAVYLTGRNARGYYDLRTWGISPPIQLTPAGLKHADPELIVAFSRDMFNAQGIAPNGMTYDALATLWVQCGGRPQPPWDGPPVPVPPDPGPGPVPPAPGPSPCAMLIERILSDGSKLMAAASERMKAARTEL